MPTHGRSWASASVGRKFERAPYPAHRSAEQQNDRAQHQTDKRTGRRPKHSKNGYMIDLTTPESGAIGLSTFFNMVREWRLTEKEQAILLGVECTKLPGSNPSRRSVH